MPPTAPGSDRSAKGKLEATEAVPVPEKSRGAGSPTAQLARNRAAVVAGHGPRPLLLHLSFGTRRWCWRSSAGAGPPW